MLNPSNDLTIEQYQELNFLRFFYDEARHAMGPADDDIYRMIKEDYAESGRVLPKQYALEEEEEEEEE